MPSSPYALLAEDFEALVRRAARVGHLDPYDLLDTYRRLQPSGHPLLADERKVDLEALSSALATLPQAFAQTARVYLVPRLAAYAHQPLESPGVLAAGRLADGSLIIEARAGHVSLIGLAVSLCAITHELDKARALLPDDLTLGGELGDVVTGEDGVGDDAVGDDGVPGDDIEAPVADDGAAGDEAEAPASDGVALGPGGAADEAPVMPLGEPDSAQAAEADRGKTDAAAAAAGSAGDHDQQEDAPGNAAFIARLAFALGTDELSLLEADSKCGSMLLTLLDPNWEMPELLIHADMEGRGRWQRADSAGERLAASLAEMGLFGRPTHLWIGGPIITECVSPYSRELRDALMHWAAAHADAAGEDIDLEAAIPGEDLLYAIARDFVATGSNLALERAEAERTVGIQHGGDDLPFEVLDLRRLDPRLCDARLPPWGRLQSDPIVLRLPLDGDDAAGPRLLSLLRRLAPNLASITVMLEGTALNAKPGTLILPDVLIRWAGEHLVALPGGSCLQAAEFASLSDAVVVGGAGLSITHPGLLSIPHLVELSGKVPTHAIEVGGAHTLAALAEGVWTGLLGPEVEMGWGIVATSYVRNGRPSADSLTGQAAVAIWRLRRILAAAAPKEPMRRESGGGRPTPGSGRPVRIKA